MPSPPNRAEVLFAPAREKPAACPGTGGPAQTNVNPKPALRHWTNTLCRAVPTVPRHRRRFSFWLGFIPSQLSEWIPGPSAAMPGYQKWYTDDATSPGEKPGPRGTFPRHPARANRRELFRWNYYSARSHPTGRSLPRNAWLMQWLSDFTWDCCYLLSRPQMFVRQGQILNPSIYVTPPAPGQSKIARPAQFQLPSHGNNCHL